MDEWIWRYQIIIIFSDINILNPMNGRDGNAGEENYWIKIINNIDINKIDKWLYICDINNKT